jgi:hypothetical protein
MQRFCCSLLALIGVIVVLATRSEAGPLDPPGAPASTDAVRVPGTPIAAPTTISVPGHYYLTRNLSVSGSSALTIDADDVTLDLGGFTISGTDGVSTSGISVLVRERVTIRNGTVRDAATGISAVNGRKLRLQNVRAHSNLTGLSIGEDAVVEDCMVTANSTGINISGARAVVRRCQVSANTSSGIATNPMNLGIVIEDSIIKNNNITQFPAQGGIRADNSDRMTIRNNDFDSNGVADIQLTSTDDTVVIDNVLNCPTSVIDTGTNNFFPISVADPHTNRTHRAAC